MHFLACSLVVEKIWEDPHPITHQELLYNTEVDLRKMILLGKVAWRKLIWTRAGFEVLLGRERKIRGKKGFMQKKS